MNLYITQDQPNGTSDLIITDSDGQIVDYISEAVFCLFNYRSTKDTLGGVCGLINGDSVGYFDAEHEVYEFNNDTNTDDLQEFSFADALLKHGEYQGVELVMSVSKQQVLK